MSVGVRSRAHVAVLLEGCVCGASCGAEGEEGRQGGGQEDGDNFYWGGQPSGEGAGRVLGLIQSLLRAETTHQGHAPDYAQL